MAELGDGKSGGGAGGSETGGASATTGKVEGSGGDGSGPQKKQQTIIRLTEVMTGATPPQQYFGGQYCYPGYAPNPYGMQVPLPVAMPGVPPVYPGMPAGMGAAFAPSPWGAMPMPPYGDVASLPVAPPMPVPGFPPVPIPGVPPLPAATVPWAVPPVQQPTIASGSTYPMYFQQSDQQQQPQPTQFSNTEDTEMG